jgi:hypothetical protein
MSPPVALQCSRLDNKIIGQTTGRGKFQICLASFYGIGPRPVYHQRTLPRVPPRHQGCGFIGNHILWCESQEDTLLALKEKMAGRNPPTAVFASNTLASRYVLSAVLHLGLKMPTDLAFVGFDDFDMAEAASPPLTVVRQPAQEMGRVATSQLFDRIERGALPQTGSRIVLPVEIVLRRSCGCKHRTPLVIG